MSAHAEIIAELRRVLNERDEARRERDEARASCPDCAMWAERSARWHDDMQRAERERDEAQAELGRRPPYTPSEIEWLNRAALADRQYMTEYDARKIAERERDEWRDKFHALNQTAGELCNACGWAFKIPGESCRCEVVKERDEARASLAQIRRVFGNAIAFDDARGDIVKMAEIAYRGACDGDKAVGELRGMTRQRDEARAEVERLRETKDYLRTWLSSEEMEGLRVKAAEHPLLWEEIHHLKAEVKRLRSEAAGYSDGAQDAYRRGAEAMREACQQWCRAWENNGEAIADALADLRVEDKP